MEAIHATKATYELTGKRIHFPSFDLTCICEFIGIRNDKTLILYVSDWQRVYQLRANIGRAAWKNLRF